MPFFSNHSNANHPSKNSYDDDDATSLLRTFSGRSSMEYRDSGATRKLPLLANDNDDGEVYIVQQRHGYFSIFFSVVQTGILIAMMVDCGVAPLKMNPMLGPYPTVLSYWGGKNAYLIVYMKEYWRLITPIMLHRECFTSLVSKNGAAYRS